MEKIEYIQTRYVKDAYVRHTRSGSVGVITNVNDKFGYIEVDYIAPSRWKKIYSSHDEKTLRCALHVMTDIEIADFRLAQENSGLSDSWQE